MIIGREKGIETARGRNFHSVFTTNQIRDPKKKEYFCQVYICDITSLRNDKLLDV